MYKETKKVQAGEPEREKGEGGRERGKGEREKTKIVIVRDLCTDQNDP